MPIATPCRPLLRALLGAGLMLSSVIAAASAQVATNDPMAAAAAELAADEHAASQRADEVFRRFQRIERRHEEQVALVETVHLVAHNGIQPSGSLAVLAAALDRATAPSERRLARQATAAIDAQEALAAARRRRAAFARARSDQKARDTARKRGGPVPTDVPGNLDPNLILYGFGGSHTAGVSARLIDRFLERHHSPMAGSGGAFIESGLRWRVDPRLLVAIAGAESSFGTIVCAPNNAWGWGCPTSPQSFASWEAGIDDVAEGLRRGYLDDGLHSVEAIHRRYAPPGAANDPGGLNLAWPVNVNRYLLALGGDPADVRGVSYAEASTGRQ